MNFLVNQKMYTYIYESYGFSSSQVQMWELDHKEGWVPKSWCFQTVELKKTLESPLDCKETKPVTPKGNQPWIFIRRILKDTEVEAPILWPPDVKSQLIGKDHDAGKDWRQKEKRVAENEMVRQHHRLMDMNLSNLLGDSGRQRSLACCSPWGHRESNMTLVTEQRTAINMN